ncbi:MAG: hypothetical protein KH230_16015 [Enterocloster asparagiformis]|nr:hypothetical protein [Enterocloster asparagiformis]
MALNQTFRVPVRELLDPFYTERAGPHDLARFTRRTAIGKGMQAASIWLIVIFTAYELMSGLKLVIHLLFLALALVVGLAGPLVSRSGQRKMLGVMERRCDPALYAALMYENALELQRARMLKKSVREQACGVCAGNFAAALCYMGRWEEARELASRLMRCEPTLAEEMNCFHVMVRYYYHHMEAEALRETVQDMRWAAAGLKSKQARLLLRSAERLEEISRAFKESGLEAAYQVCRDRKPVKDTPLARVQQAWELGRMELALGRTEQATEHLAYAAEHGRDVCAAREARALLERKPFDGGV